MLTRRSAPVPTLGIAALVLLVAGLGTGARAQDAAEPAVPAAGPVPVVVTATIDAAELTTTGLFTIRLDFAVEEDVKRALALDVELTERGRVLLGWTHVPTPPPSNWRKGETVRCDLLAPFPTEAATGARLDVRMAFRDAAGALLPPRGASSLTGARVVVAQIDVPTFEPVVGEDRVQRILAAADELAKARRKPDAWAALEFGVRGAPEDATKYRLRDAMTRLEFDPRPLTQVEERIVAQRIADERRRWLGDEANRLYGQKKLHAALRILTEIGGMLEEDANAAVFGAAEHARLAKKDVHDLRLRIWERCEPAEKEQAEKALATLGRTRAALEKAKGWIRDGRFAPAWQLLKDLEVSDVKEVAAAARHEARALEQKILDAVPADEQKAADAALHHPAFARTTVSLSHQFVFIGPRTLVESIPPESKRALDLAYVFLTDLFGRRPNPQGDRVTVYFKELWEVGGAAADGNSITVGQARPDARGTAVDTELMFHELTHCVDDTRPIHEGFREGLADFGAAYADEALARAAAASRAFDEAIRAFQRQYLSRDLDYWRIQRYQPSAGFLLHFSEKYARVPDGHDWKPWRRFFREYRASPVRDIREPCVMRAFAHYLVRAFGRPAFDDLIAFRFPLVAGDLEAIEKELGAFQGGARPLPDRAPEFAGFTNSPLVRDLVQWRAYDVLQRGDEDETRLVCRDELGVQFEWRVIGPFEPDGADAGVQPFPPEHEVDFAKEYPQRLNTARWKRVTEPGPVSIDPLGWVSLRHAYMDDTATYALTHVSADAERDAHVYVRADDALTLFVNDERIDSYEAGGWNGISSVGWQGFQAHPADAIRFRVRLLAGRNKVLLKIRNRSGTGGFVLAVAGVDGRPIPGLRGDADAPAPPEPREEPKWRPAARLDFRTKAGLHKVDVKRGGFDVVNKCAAGTATAIRVPWRKFTMRPGFPSDIPANVAWLDEKLTEGIEDFRLAVRLAPPKQRAHELAITFQGDGDAFGLSGCNVLLWDSRGKVAGQVERYDDVTYQWTPREAAPQGGPERESDLVVVTYAGRRLSVSVNGVPLLTDASIRPIPGKSRIGLATWGPDLRIASLTLESTSRRPVASQADDGLDIDFAAAAKLTGDDFEDFLDRVLARWRRAADATKRTQLFDGATSVGPAIVGPLIMRLDALDAADRAAAHALLRHATGLDFGYDPAAEPAAREEAVYWWQAWWMKSKPRLVFDPAARRLVVR